MVSQSDMARLALQRAAIEQASLSELQKLTPSSAIANEYKDFLDMSQTVANETRELGQDAESSNKEAETKILKSSAALLEKMVTTARRLGFDSCAQLS